MRILRPPARGLLPATLLVLGIGRAETDPFFQVGGEGR